MMWNPSTSEVTKQAALSHYRTLGFEPIITEREIKGYSINRVWRAVKKSVCTYGPRDISPPQNSTAAG